MISFCHSLLHLPFETNEVKRRIYKCILLRSSILDLSSLNLTVLPTLPDTLTKLYCYDNQLTVLPELPDTLTDLFCYNNQLIGLPVKLLRNNCYVNADNKEQLYINTSKSIIIRALTKRKWIKYFRQWIVAKSIDHLFDCDTGSVIASFC
jgi:hypothetical protein